MGISMGSMQGLIALLLPIILMGCISHSDQRTEQRKKAATNYMNLAKGYLQEGYTEKAIKPLNRALEITPRSSEVHGMFGLLYQVQGETKQAEKSFKKALHFNSDAADVYNNYGAFLFSQGRLDDAYSALLKAAENIDYEKRSRAFENLGIVAQRQGKAQQARQHFEKSLRLNGNLSRARLELAALLKEQGEYQLAWSHYLTFTRYSNQNSRSLWLGIQLARVNGNKDAVASYELQLERLYPQSEELKIYRQRGEHYKY